MWKPGEEEQLKEFIILRTSFGKLILIFFITTDDSDPFCKMRSRFLLKTD